MYYKSNKPSNDEIRPVNMGEDSIALVSPDILYNEFEKSLYKLKNRKASGI